MAYDATLAARIRALLGQKATLTERAMFGGVAWMLGGNMFVGIVKDRLMVRVGADSHDEAVAQPHARIMDFTGRPMRGYVYVEPPGLKTDTMLGQWIARGEAFARTLPPKRKKNPKAKG